MLLINDFVRLEVILLSGPVPLSAGTGQVLPRAHHHVRRHGLYSHQQPDPVPDHLERYAGDNDRLVPILRHADFLHRALRADLRHYRPLHA